MSQPAATVRDAVGPGDFEAVAALHGAVYTREYGMDATMEAHVAQGLADLRRAWDADGDQTAGRLWVADTGGRVVGAAGLVRDDDRPGWSRLRWVVVAPEARGQGLGRRLFATAMDEARARRSTGVYLWTMVGLDAARHLYTSAGFKVSHSHEIHQWGIDAVEQRMELPL